jgi:hypothetical protein
VPQENERRAFEHEAADPQRAVLHDIRGDADVRTRDEGLDRSTHRQAASGRDAGRTNAMKNTDGTAAIDVVADEHDMVDILAACLLRD